MFEQKYAQKICMPNLIAPNLSEVHAILDRAVEQAYGVNFKGDESAIVTHLFHLYSQATEEK